MIGTIELTFKDRGRAVLSVVDVNPPKLGNGMVIFYCERMETEFAYNLSEVDHYEFTQ